MSENSPQRPLPDTRNAGAPYWRAAAEGRLVLPRCVPCAAAFWYPRWHCPRCGSDRIEWISARGTGRVHTYTVVRQSGDPFFRTRLPIVVAMVELDEGPRLLSNLVDCDVGAIAIGMSVIVHFEPAQGGFAIPLFRPAKAGGAA